MRAVFRILVIGVINRQANADAAAVHHQNRNFGGDPGIFDAGTPYRASDRDALVIGLGPTN